MRYLPLLVLILFSSVNCKSPKAKELNEKVELAKEENSLTQKASNQISTISIAQDTVLINGSIGLITLLDNFSENDTIKIYNKDRSLWHKFTFYYDDSDGKYEFDKPEFSPYAFHPDNFLLCMKVTGQSENGLIPVVVNEETMMTKYIESNSSILAFQTWENCILNSFAVDFDPGQNPIFTGLDTASTPILYDADETYYPVKIAGEKLQVKWGNEDDWQYGWIQWKNKEKLLVEPHFFG